MGGPTVITWVLIRGRQKCQRKGKCDNGIRDQSETVAGFEHENTTYQIQLDAVRAVLRAHSNSGVF